MGENGKEKKKARIPTNKGIEAKKLIVNNFLDLTVLPTRKRTEKARFL